MEDNPHGFGGQQRPAREGASPASLPLFDRSADGFASMPAQLTGIAQAVNDTYSYASNNLFPALAPIYYKNYAYRYVRPACQWLDGYVPSVHQNGIASTRIASRLITGLNKQICGERVLFKVNDADDVEHRTLHRLGEWYEEAQPFRAIFAGCGYALALGTSLIKVNRDLEGKVWWEPVRFDSAFYESDFRGQVTEATFLLKSYYSNKKEDKTVFYLTEHRFWRVCGLEVMRKMDGTVEMVRRPGDRVPMVEYRVHACKADMAQNLESVGADSRKWAELPDSIRKMVKQDYSAIKLDEPIELGLVDLGVAVLRNGNVDLSVPNTSFGESLIVGIQTDLITYELAESYRIRDMYLGKGTVYVPKAYTMGGLSGSGFASNLTGIGDTSYEQVDSMNPDKDKIVVNQFALRGTEWEQIKEDALKGIAVKWGMSPKILASFLAQAQQTTATQVDSEDDMCIAFISHTRAYFKPSIDALLRTTMMAMGMKPNATIEFASPSLINKDRILKRVIDELGNGLIDIEDAIRTLFPDLDEEAIQNKIVKARQFQDRKAFEARNQLDEILGGEPTLEAGDEE